MADLKLVASALFSKRGEWKSIADEEKEGCFFIINRMFSKVYPEKAQLFNHKGINKATAMDLWFHFMKNKPYPNWFWSKSPKAESHELPEKDFKLLLYKLGVKDSDLIYLIEKHPEFIKEELKFYKSQEKGN
jgi:hypothetical protein